MPPEPLPIAPGDLPPHFWAKVRRGSVHQCWEWTGATSSGYGTFGWHGRIVKAHRLAYTQLRGPIPDGKSLDHLCRNTICVNPAHLEPVTHYENMRRGRNWTWWREITHCPKGHPYDATNTYLYRGGRRCITCSKEYGRTKNPERRGKKNGNEDKTHCKRGHPLTGDNVYSPPKRPDRRYCRACQKERNKRLSR